MTKEIRGAGKLIANAIHRAVWEDDLLLFPNIPELIKGPMLLKEEGLEGAKTLSRETGIPLASELRSPPLVGETYLVWTIKSRNDQLDWPVHLPGHEDSPGAGYHYHQDVRFWSEEQERIAAEAWDREGAYREASPWYGEHSPSMLPDGLKHGMSYQRGPYDLGTPRRPKLRPFQGDPYDPGPRQEPKLRALQCRHSLPKWDVDQDRDHWLKEGERLMDHVDRCAITTKSGRIVCPHQMFDLTSWVPEGATEVRCPLHGLLLTINRDCTP